MIIVCWRWGWAAGTVDLRFYVYIGLAGSVTPCIFKVFKVLPSGGVNPQL